MMVLSLRCIAAVLLLSWCGAFVPRALRSCQLGKRLAEQPARATRWVSMPAVGAKQRLASSAAFLTVGDAVVAEVDDIVGSVGDPTVTFLVRDGSKTRRASMPTKFLSATERLALQTGSVMQVYVARMDGASADAPLQVSLKPLDGSSGGRGPSISTQQSYKTAANPAAAAAPARGDWSASPSRGGASKAPRAPRTTGGGIPTKLPDGALLLNNLKTGMELQGTVQSTTNYAAFVAANVYRSAKGGKVSEINGLLHKADIIDGVHLNLNHAAAAKGTKLKVYVKEVFKQSGRFSLTTDPTIDKDRVREQKLKVREDGNERRRSRRVRRQLDAVAVGDTVRGVVQQVVPAGVLVTVTSLGPLNITGLIAKKDLPKQFEVPPDMKESFQAQLLAQDFVPGRPITCGVLQVNPNVRADSTYCLKMLFEELGDFNDDDVVITDSGERKVGAGAVGADDDEEEDADGDVDNDLREIYDELRGNKPLVAVADLKDWADVQDMIQSGVIDAETLDGAVQEVLEASGQKLKKGSSKDALMLSFEQFVEIVDVLQDAMDGMTTDLDDFDYEDDEGDDVDVDFDDDDDAAATPAPAKPLKKVADVKPALNPIMAAADNGAAPAKGKDAAGKGAKAKAAPAAEEEEKDDEEGAYDDLDDEETMREVAKELYDELRGSKEQLSLAAMKDWEDIKDLVKDGLVSQKDVDKVIADVAGAQKQVAFEEFYAIVSRLEDMAYEAAGEEEEDADDDDDEEEKAGEEDEYDEDEDVDEADLRADAQELFDGLRGSAKTVPVSAIATIPDVQDLLADGLLTKEELNSLVADVNGKAKTLAFNEFFRVIAAIDAIADRADANDEETMREVAQELYDDLRGSKDQVSLSAFKSWADVKDLLEDELITEDQFDEIITDVLGGGKQLNFEQFYELITRLDELAEAPEDEEDGVDGPGDTSATPGGDEEGDPELDELSEDDLRALAQELYDELRGEDAQVSVSGPI